MKSTMAKMVICIASILFAGMASGQKYQPTPENLKAREWFQDARFGMFIHWGVYSVMGGGGDQGIGEWIMHNKQIPIDAYEKLPGFFNPIGYSPKEWVQLAKNAGMKYITITSKHHDGFAMYDSQVSDYNIVKRTPYGKDIIRMLKEECDREGIKLFFYYSQLDWHHPDYFPRGSTGGSYTGRPERGNWQKYLDFQHAQLTELLTNYGEIGGIWFDGWWDKKSLPNNGDWQLEKTYELIHRLQPQTLIGNNHHMPPFDGEDFQMFEKDLPGKNTTGFSADAEIGNLPLETCETINGSWGFNLKDRKHKSPKDLIHYLVKAAGHNSNFLLNVGPMPDGRIQHEHIAILEKMGEWNKLNGATIYGTRQGPYAPTNWGVSTQKANKIYLHILDLSDDVLAISKPNGKIESIRFFKDQSTVAFQDTRMGLVLQIPANKRDEIDTIVEITLRP
jgi:alpha-L-fucosidase